MALYEYVCLACERPFEERRAMSSAVDIMVRCPSCGTERVRRRFAFLATRPGGDSPSAGGGCACGGACGCG